MVEDERARWHKIKKKKEGLRMKKERKAWMEGGKDLRREGGTRTTYFSAFFIVSGLQCYHRGHMVVLD